MALDEALGDTVGSGQSPGRVGAFARRHRVAIAAPIVYLVASVWVYFPLLRHLRSAQSGGADTSLFTWWLGWTPYALTHGHSPFVTAWINAPHGANAMWQTSILLLGLLLSPITLALGPVAAVNLLMAFTPMLSAWSAFLGARILGLQARTALAVGFLYGFSTYTLQQNGTGHLHLAFGVFPPLATALLAKIVDGTVSARKGGLLLGLAGALQAFVSEEILATSGLLTLIVLAILAWRCPREQVKEAAGRLVRATLWALAVALPLALPALIVQFFGPGALSSGVGVGAISSDLLTPITPTHTPFVGKLLSSGLRVRIQTDAAEVHAYIGLPLVAVLLLNRRRLRATSLRWCWVPLLVAAVLCIGWTVTLAGFSTHIPGPGRFMARIPLLVSVLTTRFALYLVLFSALLGGALWDATNKEPLRVRRWAAVLAGLVVLAILPTTARVTRISNPAAFASGKPLPGVPDGATVAILPWPNYLNDAAMRYQAVNGFHFKLVGAYGVFAGKDGVGQYGTKIPLLNKIAVHIAGDKDGPPPAGGKLEHIELNELAQLKTQASALVIAPMHDSATVAAYLTSLLHEQPTFTGGVYIFALPGH